MIRPIGMATLIGDPRRNKDVRLAGDRPEKIEITESGLVAAIHRAGIGQVGSYFRWLEENGWNSRDNQRTMTSKFRQVETRLREFQKVPYK